MARAYGRIAALRPTNTTENDLIAGVPASTEYVGTLNICNQTGSAANYRVAQCDNTTTEVDDWLTYDQNIDANSTQQITGIAMSVGEFLVVRSSASNAISFVFSGMTIT